jgi:hypothetical protein
MGIIVLSAIIANIAWQWMLQRGVAVNLLLDISVNQEKLHKNFLKLEMAPWGRQMLVRSILGSRPQAGFCGSSTRECHA